MDFHVDHEIRVIRKVVKHVCGPCLMCGHETEYGSRVPRLGMIWLRKQFEPRAHIRNLRAVRIGVVPRGKSLAVLEALICEVCRAELTKIRQDASAERDAELRRRSQLRDRYYEEMEAERERDGRGWGETEIP